MIFFQLSFLDSGFLVYLIFLCIENIWLVLFVQPIIWSKNFCFCALCWWCLMCESVLIDGLLFVSIFLFSPTEWVFGLSHLIPIVHLLIVGMSLSKLLEGFSSPFCYVSVLYKFGESCWKFMICRVLWLRR